MIFVLQLVFKTKRELNFRNTVLLRLSIWYNDCLNKVDFVNTLPIVTWLTKSATMNGEYVQTDHMFPVVQYQLLRHKTWLLQGDDLWSVDSVIRHTGIEISFRQFYEGSQDLIFKGKVRFHSGGKGITGDRQKCAGRLLTYSLHGAESFLSSWLACS